MLTVRLIACTQPEKKIHCIKNLRAATGLGLRESKDIVDNLTGYGPPSSLPEIKVPENGTHLLDDYFTYEVVGGIVPDPARLALRAAVIDVTPATLASLAAALPVGSESRLLFDEAVSLLRSVGA